MILVLKITFVLLIQIFNERTFSVQKECTFKNIMHALCMLLKQFPWKYFYLIILLVYGTKFKSFQFLTMKLKIKNTICYDFRLLEDRCSKTSLRTLLNIFLFLVIKYGDPVSTFRFYYLMQLLNKKCKVFKLEVDKNLTLQIVMKCRFLHFILV